MEQDCNGVDGESSTDRGTPPPPPEGGASLSPTGGVLASLCGIPEFLILGIRGTV